MANVDPNTSAPQGEEQPPVNPPVAPEGEEGAKPHPTGHDTVKNTIGNVR